MNKPDWASIGGGILVILIGILLGEAVGRLDFGTVVGGTIISLVILFGVIAITLRYVHSIYETQLKKIVDELKSALPSAKYDWLYRADDINEIEAHVKCKDIWVISPDLSNDTSLAAINIIDTVKKNLKKKITYTYIVPDTETIKAVIPRLYQIFIANSQQLQIIKIPHDTFKKLTTAHIVIYNPNMENGQTPQVYLELPIDERGYGKGFWVKAADDAALDLVGRFRNIVEERKP